MFILYNYKYNSSHFSDMKTQNKHDSFKLDGLLLYVVCTMWWVLTSYFK